MANFDDQQLECRARVRQIDSRCFSRLAETELSHERLAIILECGIDRFDVIAYYMVAEMLQLSGTPAKPGFTDEEMLENLVKASATAMGSQLAPNFGETVIGKALTSAVVAEFELKLRSKQQTCLAILDRCRTAGGLPLADLDAFCLDLHVSPMRSRADWWKTSAGSVPKSDFAQIIRDADIVLERSRAAIATAGTADVPQSTYLEAPKGIKATEEPAQPQAEPNAPVTAERGELSPELSTGWESVQIFFVSDLRVQVLNGIENESYNYNELGFEDGRTGNPNQAWLILRRLAECDGAISTLKQAGCKWPSVEKRIQEIRKVLRSHFGIRGDPIPFTKGTGYRARFKISLSKSFHS